MAILLFSLYMAAAPPLVGVWTHNGDPFVVLRADGTGTRDGEVFRWRAAGNLITVATSEGIGQIPFRLGKDQLTVVVEGQRYNLRRAGKGVTAAAAAAIAAPPAGSTGTPLARLLLSSAWCSFWYNKVTGYSGSKRYVFHRDGTWSLGGRAEGYSSGHGGTMASQRNSRAAGRWQVRGARLFLSESLAGPLADVRLVVKRNSAGRPIVVADGAEFSQCR